MDIIREKLKLLPNKPGCYLMKNSNNEIIYVGKAKNLSNRVKSYFTGKHNVKTEKLVENIADFEYIITSSDTEAYLLEINLIKENHPKYNIMLMDDKTYPYIYLTDEESPRLIVTRDPAKFKKRVKGMLFGPYPNATAVNKTVDMLNKMYPLRKCRNIPKVKCLYYSLGQCLGPCINKIEKEKWQEIKDEIAGLLKKTSNEQLKIVEQKMNEASENLEFEKAIMYRDIIKNINELNNAQKITSNDLGNRDIFGYAIKDDLINIQVFHIRFGKVIERTGETFELIDSVDEILAQYILQFYDLNSNILPDEIVMSETANNDVISELLNVKITVPQKGDKKKLLDLVNENALNTLDTNNKIRLNKYKKTKEPLIELAKLVNIEYPKRIEIFDNSNISGQSAVSGMVVYIDGIPSKKDYRKFKIKTVKGADDFHTMIEVITRRYSRLLQEEKQMPNLLILDGGEPQVKAAKMALDNIGVNINLIGLVKDDNHKTRAIVTKDLEEINIDKHSALFLLLEAMQEEVHRFAITYFRSKAAKEVTKSILDNIEGIGKKRKIKLLKAFDNIYDILNASEEEIKKTGIPKPVIENVKKKLKEIQDESH